MNYFMHTSQCLFHFCNKLLPLQFTAPVVWSRTLFAQNTVTTFLLLYFCTEELVKKENEENEAHHAQCQENEDQHRGESSSSITSKTRIYFRGKVIEKGRDFVRSVHLFADGENAGNFMFGTWKGTIRPRRLTTSTIRTNMIPLNY